MILTLDNGTQIRGDLIKSAVVRSDLAPVPMTLEAQIRVDDDMSPFLEEGRCLTIGTGDAMRIIKSNKITDRMVQGDRMVSGIELIALLDSCHKVAFVQDHAIITESTTLSGVYRASGATIPRVTSDFPVERFVCYAGDVPSFHIARVLQEEGGVVCWRDGTLRVMRLADLFRQKPVATLPNNASDDVESGFLERHAIPAFLSTAPDGRVVLGNTSKTRCLRYVPFKDAVRLRNMSRCLIRRKVKRMDFAGHLSAGDLIDFSGGTPLCIITAAHVYTSGTDGSAPEQYTRLWLGSLAE